MNKFLPAFLVTALLFAGVGCKPSSPPGTGQATPPTGGGAPRQPTAGDLQAFLRAGLPADLKLSDAQMDPPARMPNTSPADNAWVFNVKLTFTPDVDLLSLPPAEDAQAINQLTGELNSLVAWRNTYVNSPYAKACGGLEVKVPTVPMPQLLVVTQSKGRALPPIYGKMAAEWQVDHWQFMKVDLPVPESGQPRSSFRGATMVKGSPEAEKALDEVRDAISQARKDIEAIRDRYTEQVVRGVKPGTTYNGTVSFRANVAPCELRFLDPPPGGDARFASFQITLSSQNPACWYVYKARVSTELPIPVPGPQPTPTNPYAVTGFGEANAVPGHNVFQQLVRSSNFKVGRDTLASWLGENDHGGQALLLLGGRVEGLINDFAGSGIKLSVQQATP